VTSDDTTRDPASIYKKDVTANEAELIEQMQLVILFFLDLIQVTGGVLAPEKCVWYFIADR
jgi:hypothetical protein